MHIHIKYVTHEAGFYYSEIRFNWDFGTCLAHDQPSFIPQHR